MSVNTVIVNIGGRHLGTFKCADTINVSDLTLNIENTAEPTVLNMQWVETPFNVEDRKDV